MTVDHRYTTAFPTSSPNPSGWTSSADQPVHVIELSVNGSTLFIGGEFFSVGGRSQTNIAALSASNGIARSWDPNIADNTTVEVMALSSDGTSLYIGGDFTEIDGNTRSRVAKLNTVDASLTTWNPVVEGNEGSSVKTMALANLGVPVRAVAVEPGNSNIVYAGTESGLYKSTDGGTGWATANEGLASQLIFDILIDPNTPSTLYVATWEGGIFKSTNRGENWTAANNGLTHLNARTLAMAADSSLIFAGTESFSETEGGIYKSEDGGSSWSLKAVANVLSVAVDPNNKDILYAGTSNGLFVSENGGEDYSDRSDGLEETTVNDVVVSTDIVESDSDDDSEANNSTIYVANGTSVHKSTNAGEDWIRARSGLPNATVVKLAIDPNNTQRLYASTLGQGIFKVDDIGVGDTDEDGDDDGIRWTDANTGVENPIVYSLAVDPTNSSTVYAGTSLSLIFKSTDGGDNWVEAHEGIPNDILYIGGDFTGYIAALDTMSSATEYFLNWPANSTNSVNALHLTEDNNTLYAGGAFTSIGGQPRNRIAALNTADAKATEWAPSVDDNDGVVEAIDLTSDERQLYLGGSFARVESTARSNLAAVNTATPTVTDWNPVADNTVESLLVTNHDNLVFAAGSFLNIGGQARAHLASLRTTVSTNNATVWAPDPDKPISGGNAIVNNGLTIYIGGQFKRIHQRSNPSLAVYAFQSPDGSADPLGRPFNVAQTIELRCKDNSNTRCDNKFFTADENLDEATWTTYTVPFTLDTTTTLSFYVEDDEGTRSDTVTDTYIFDYADPTISGQLRDGTYPVTQVAPLICNDGDLSDSAVSGCAEVFYTTDGSTPAFQELFDSTRNIVTYEPSGTSKLYTEPVAILIDTELRFMSIDEAGNSSEVGVSRFKIVRGEGGGTIGALTFVLLLVTYSLRTYRTRKWKCYN